jgi:hypothetical protein
MGNSRQIGKLLGEIWRRESRAEGGGGEESECGLWTLWTTIDFALERQCFFLLYPFFALLR